MVLKSWAQKIAISIFGMNRNDNDVCNRLHRNKMKLIYVMQTIAQI